MKMQINPCFWCVRFWGKTYRELLTHGRRILARDVSCIYCRIAFRNSGSFLDSKRWRKETRDDWEPFDFVWPEVTPAFLYFSDDSDIKYEQSQRARVVSASLSIMEENGIEWICWMTLLSLTCVNSQRLHLHRQRAQIINAFCNTLTLLPSIPPNYHQSFPTPETYHKSHAAALKRQQYPDTPQSPHPIDL